MHRCPAWVKWAVQLLQRTASLPRGSGQWNSCNAVPHCLGVVGSGTAAMHCLTAWGQRAVEHLQCSASVPRGSGQCNSYKALRHCLGGQRAVEILPCTASLPGRSGQCNSCKVALTARGHWAVQFLQRRPQCPWAAGIGSPAMPCHTAWRKVVELLQCTASEPGGSRQWNSCNAPPHCLGAVCSGTPAMQCLTTWGQWAVQLLQSTTSLPGGSGQGKSCTARAQWALQLLQCTASLPGGSGQWNGCNAVPHYVGAVGPRTLAMHCLTARA